MAIPACYNTFMIPGAHKVDLSTALIIKCYRRLEIPRGKAILMGTVFIRTPAKDCMILQGSDELISKQYTVLIWQGQEQQIRKSLWSFCACGIVSTHFSICAVRSLKRVQIWKRVTCKGFVPRYVLVCVSILFYFRKDLFLEVYIVFSSYAPSQVCTYCLVCHAVCIRLAAQMKRDL